MFRLKQYSAIALSILALQACDGSVSTQPVEFRIPVEVEEVTTSTVEDMIITTGTLRTRESVVLNVETPGFLILGKDVDGNRLAEGSRVTAGQLIAEITGEDARLAARMEATKRHLESAEEERDRRRQLYQQKSIALEDVRRAEASYEDALHDYDTSLRTFQKARITTPIAGVILQLIRDPNNIPVADGQKVMQGFIVAQIAPTDKLIADIDLVGPELAKVRKGQLVRIHHYAFDDRTMAGTILRLSPSMDQQTHSFRAEVEVDNSKGLLRPGMFIQASIITERRESVTVVPRDAITQRAGRNVIFIIDGQRAVRRNITIGLIEDDRIEVREGVKPGERIVVRGLETLTDDTRVRVISS